MTGGSARQKKKRRREAWLVVGVAALVLVLAGTELGWPAWSVWFGGLLFFLLFYSFLFSFVKRVV